MQEQEEKYLFSPNLFWDADMSDLDMDKHASYVVGRVLDYGSLSDWVLIRKYYGMEKIKEIALGIRSIERRSLALIATIVNIPQNKFRCYEQMQSKTSHWYF
ncbi:hypothetical protein FACS1894199_04070 [Bacteroidia bacterium]|nr:hypothetical protein FACS1894199_04070 [Bacteroidia bacterium]